MAQTRSCWVCWQAPARLARLRERVSGPWMEDPCSASPLPTCTLALPLPLRVTFLHICHSGNGKREAGKEQWRHGKRSTWLTINCQPRTSLGESERLRGREPRDLRKRERENNKVSLQGINLPHTTGVSVEVSW